MTPMLRFLFGSASIALIACQPAPGTPESADTRTPVPLPPEAAEAVRAEMRTMLASLHDIHRGLATGDTALVRRAAIASGLAAAADPELEPLLPAEFMRMGVAAHSGFDSLAQAVARMPVDSLVARLPPITENCVACHGVYRLAPAVTPR